MFYVPDLALRYKEPIHKSKGRVTLKKIVPFLSPILQQKVTWAAGKSFFLLYSEQILLFISSFFHFCAELAFKNERKTDSVMYASE